MVGETYSRCPMCGGEDGQGCYPNCPSEQIPALQARIERLRAALREIAKTTYGYEPFMTDEEAKNYFASRFFGAQAKARAALREEK